MSQQRVLAAIMFTDLVGYSALMGKDSSAALELLRISKEIQKPLVEKNNGRWLKEIGDGAMAQFNTALNAVKCSIEIQESARKNLDGKLRIGINLGDVTIENDDIYGNGVNIASRLESIADAGGIYISDSVEKAIRGQTTFSTKYLGELALKNISYGVRTFAVQGGNLPEVDKTRLRTYTYNHDQKSIAVLPFSDVSPAGDQKYLSEGFSEEILNILANIPELKVIGKISSSRFNTKNLDLIEIGNLLGVSTVLEGSVQKSGDRIKIIVKLIDVSDGTYIWSEKYNREVNDIFDIQDEISESIAHKLKLTLLRNDGFRAYKPDRETYEIYLKGLYFWNKRDSNLIRAIEYFEEAVAKDPSYSLAYASLAQSYAMCHVYDIKPSKHTTQHALIYAEKAIMMDGNSAEAYAAKGIFSLFGLWDIGSAEKMLRQAIAINPNYPSARYWLVGPLIFSNKGQEAVDEANFAVRLEPISVASISILALALHKQRLFDESLVQSKLANDLNPTGLSLSIEMSNLIRLERFEEAKLIWEKHKKVSGTILVHVICHLYHHLNDSENLSQIYLEFETKSKDSLVPNFALGIVTWYGGDQRRAKSIITSGIEERNGQCLYYLNDFLFTQYADPELLEFIRDQARMDLRE